MSNLNKTVLVLAFVAGAFGALSAKDVKWIGADGGDWSVGDNWEGGEKPGASDTAVFNPGVEETLTVAIAAGVTVSNIQVKSGTVSLGASATHNNDITLSGGCVEIAEGAVLNQYRPLRASSRFNVTLLVCGGGRFNQYDYIGQNNYGDFGELAVSNAQFYTATDYNNLRVPAASLKAGAIAKMGTPSYAAFRDSPSLYLEEGTVFASSRETVGSLTGGGDIYCFGGYQIAVNFKKGPSCWSGRLLRGTVLDQSCPYPTMLMAKQGDVPDEDYRFVIARTDSFVEQFSTLKFEDDNDSSHTLHPLKFATGIGDFYVNSLTGKKFAPLVLEDVEGNPVNFYVKTHSIGSAENFVNYAYIAFVGSGNYYQWLPAWTGYEKVRAITNDVFRGLTGEVGIAGAAIGYPDRTLTLGTGDEATDPDLSSVLRLSADGTSNILDFNLSSSAEVSVPVVLKNGGKVRFSSDFTFNGAIFGTGTVLAPSGASFADVRTDRATFPIAADTMINTPTRAGVERIEL